MENTEPPLVRAGPLKALRPWHLALSRTIASLMDAEFETRLYETLGTVIKFDFGVIWAYQKKTLPVCLFDSFDQAKRQILVDQYVLGSYLLDPFYQACQDGIEPGPYRIRDLLEVRMGHSEYYKTYYKHAQLSDEACFVLYPSSGVGVVISLMRDIANPTYTNADFRTLVEINPIIQQLGCQRWNDVVGRFDHVQKNDMGAEDVENIMDTFLSDQLTPRESEVVSLILKGHSSNAVAEHLGLSVATVKTYRRSIYAKLRISSQGELFAKFLQAI